MINLDLIQNGDKILCALSGGADSVVLTHALFCLQEQYNLKVFACHLNHKTRNGESDLDALFVEKFCEKLGIPLYKEEISIENTKGIGFEASAREIRYEFFERAKEYFKANKIATAHNKNDNLETVLLNMCRGTGLSGLTGIKEQRNDIIRPILSVDRCEIESYIEQNGLEYVIDSTNEQNIYARNKIRNKVTPILQEINEATVNNVQNMVSSLKIDNDFLQEMSEKEYDKVFFEEDDEVFANIEDVLNMHEAIRFRVLDKAIRKFGRTLDYKKNLDILKICRSKNPSLQLNLYNTLEIFRKYDKIIFRAKKETEQILKFTKCDDSITICTNKFTNLCFKCFVDCDIIDFNTVFVSNRQIGDYINMPYGRKSLKKLFIERKIPLKDREFVPVLRDKNGIIAVCFIGTDDKYKEKENYKIIFRSI